MINESTKTWQELVKRCYSEYDYISKPRGMEVREIINGSYTVPIPAYINLNARGVNIGFMFAEAAWIISGSNRLDELTPYMKGYANFSDDGIFMRGAYGPKVIDQLGYVVDSIEKDNDTRQAVLNIWRERPGQSKDIPCTLNMQFLLREGKLHAVVNMRSNDVILGVTYDMFTFSMVAYSVVLLLRARGIDVDPGSLLVNAGSLHLYEKHYESAKRWVETNTSHSEVPNRVDEVLVGVSTYQELIDSLKKGASNATKNKK